MSHSKALLSKKGPLGTVWVAAFCGEAALTRDQVARTDIVASVDEILSDVQGPHRILAQLLFGIVRIYSKKVYYLYHDCEEIRSLQLRQCVEPSASTGGSTHGVLKQVNKAIRAGRSVAGHKKTSKVNEPVNAVRTTEVSSPVSSEGLSVRVETEVIVRTSVVIRKARVPDDLPTFTIPKRFELDSFDLGIAEDTDDEGEDHHQSARQDILLEDERHHAPYLYESYQMASCSYNVDSTCFMPEYISVPLDVMPAISEANNIPDLSTEADKPGRENQNADSAWFTPVKDVLPPDMMDMVAEANYPSDKSKTGDDSIREVNMDENNGGSACSMTHIPPQESHEEQNSENILENMTCGSLGANNPTIEASASDSLLGKSNSSLPAAGFPEHDPGQHESLEAPVLSCETRAENELSPSTPEPLPEGVPGPSSSSRFGVRTPAKTEKSQATRKRRRALYNKEDYIPTEREGRRQVRRRLTWSLYDEGTILSNEMLREAIKDATDLVRKRRKAPHTRLDTWKVAKVGSLPYTFLDPMIPYKTSISLARVSAPEAPENSCEESIRARRRLSYEHTESVHSCKDTGSTERETILDASRRRKLDEWTDIEAPVGCHTESRPVQDGVCECDEDTAKEKGTQVEGDEPSSEIPPKKGLRESESRPVQDGVCGCNEALNDQTDFEAYVSCRTESEPVQGGVCECHEDTAKEKGTQIKGDEPSSEIPPKKGLHESENQIPLHNEALNAALDNIDEDISIYDEHTRDEGLLNSTRTRKIASCLHQLFLDKKSKEGTNSLSLNQVLEGTKRRTSATFFYETLILKSRGLVQVNQEQPYEDIILSATPQLEAELQRFYGIRQYGRTI
ncbi:hypothetical protein GQ55_7G191000 [Panicum hallii var. hallii]|uniref:Rad21/Rec8-like protein N-terminal domain-containing protein n=1 Tax=Panicum hallii var. hallii TaxID=1504633 RepID=A0A2T7CWN0_9POAL|nr:hypothetical protein GQ55_7G191000 [Panicum hallii var. hallii]